MSKKLFLFEIILFVSKFSKNRNLYLSFSYFIFLNNCVLLSCRRNLKDPPRRLFNNVKILLNPLKLVIVKFGLLVKVLSTFVNHYKPSVIFAWRHFWFFFRKPQKCVLYFLDSYNIARNFEVNLENILNVNLLYCQGKHKRNKTKLLKTTERTTLQPLQTSLIPTSNAQVFSISVAPSYSLLLLVSL